ncbi:hypothetical protein MPQ_2699 [Methylovorus sp. MP688]|nr:hypothetical protein MPQ_2699 [Methylovorus sp. MP688]
MQKEEQLLVCISIHRKWLALRKNIQCEQSQEILKKFVYEVPQSLPD